MRKNSLMVAAAVAALTIGSGVAMAQSPSQPAQSGSPAKSAPPSASGSMNSSGSGATTGAGSSTEQKNVDENKASPQKGAQQDKADPKQKGAQQDKADPKQKGAQSNQSNERMGQSGKPAGKGETTGQAPGGSSGSMSKDSDQMKSGQGRTESGQSNQINRSGQDNRGQSGTTTGQSGTSSQTGTSTTTNTTNTTTNVNLTTEQRTRIKEVIVKDHSAPRVSSVDFSLSVGTHVPRNKVKLVAVPSTIVEIQPAWRGFEYFLVGDQIVIVNPRTLEIVAVVPA